MEDVFRTLLNMTYTAAAAMLFILALRLVFKWLKAPTWVCYALWGIALFRLLCPFSLESVLALLPSTEPIPQGFLTAQTPEIYTGVAVLNSVVNPALAQSLTPLPTASANPAQLLFFIGGIVWAAGVATVLITGGIGAYKLRRKLNFAIRVEDGVYESEQLNTAFVWGVFRPRAYLPAGLDQKSRAYILLHENTHIRRFDHIWKLLFYAAAAVHWFNPLVWLAFRLFEKDMELSCDESVLKRAKDDIKQPYCETLLSVSAQGKAGFPPVFFGESGVKARIKNALSYKKPALWVIVGAILLAVAAGAMLVFNPLPSASNFLKKGETPVESLVSSKLNRGYGYDYHVDGSIKSVVFFTEFYRNDPSLSLDIQGAMVDYKVMPVLETEGTISLIHYGLGDNSPPSSLSVKFAPKVLKADFESYFSIDVPALEGSGYFSDTKTLMEGRISNSYIIEPQKPVLLWMYAADKESGVFAISDDELWGSPQDITDYGYDYICLFWCSFSPLDAATLEADLAYDFGLPASSPSPSPQLTAIVPPAEISPSINFIEDGSVVELIPLEGNDAAIEVVKNAIFMHLVLSSAWPGEDMANYPDRIDIYVGDVIFEGLDGTEGSKLTQCHIFVKDGYSCIQLGDSMYTRLPEEAYNAILALREKCN